MSEVSILEFGRIDPVNGIFPNHVLEWIVKYAKAVDKLNFKRLWLTEHYNPQFAWFSPQMLLPILASQTQRIKIGQAGVVLNVHNPLFIAQNYKILCSYFPNRIDLGISYNQLEDIDSVMLTNEIDYEIKLSNLTKLLGDIQLVEDGFFKKILLPPVNITKPELWFLGKKSKNQSLMHEGNLCVSLFHNPEDAEILDEIFVDYIESFYAIYNYIPKTMLGVYFFCSEDVAVLKAEKNRHEENQRKKGILIPYIFGTLNQCQDELGKYQSNFNRSELLLMNQIPDFDLKLESTTRLSSLLANI